MGLAGFEVEVQRETRDGGLATEDMTLSMGPQHPSTHGVLRFVVRADGEVMKEAIPDIGYLHRSIEKIAEKVGWHGFMPYTDRVEPLIDEFNDLISWNKIYTERLANVAVVSARDAIDYNLVGPNLRGSGVRYDVRRDEPYSVYPDFEFDVPVGRGEMGTVGDCFDRYIVRIREMKESCKIIRQCLEKLPGGPVIAKVPRNFKPPAGDCYVRLESARGDMGWYVVSDGTAFPYRCKIRTGSFAAISIVPKVSRNLMIADLIPVIASLDLVAPEIDR